MPIRISNIRLGIDESETALPEKLAQALSLPASEISGWRILRKSLDARDKRELQFVYSAEVACAADEARLVAHVSRQHPRLQADIYREPQFQLPRPGDAALRERPIVVGSGPAGLAAAYFLAEQGYQPLVIERGQPVSERIRDVQALEEGGPHDPESNYLFGEGGAGTFSDGKLTCRNTGPDVRRILEMFAENKGKPSVVYEHRPHLGSNRLPAVVKSLRRKIEAMGGSFQFGCRLEGLDFQDGQLRGLQTSSGYLKSELLVLAIGHSARDTYEMLLASGVPMVQKPFQIGVRIEQPQEQVNRVQYGNAPLEERLGAADYTLVAHGQHDLFTFCMCAGGQVIPSVSEPGHFATNGMSLSKRASPFANSGLMVTLGTEHFSSTHVLAGMMLQRHYEKLADKVGRGQYLCPIQSGSDFMLRRRGPSNVSSSYRRGTVSTQIDEVIPPLIAETLRRALPVLDARWRGRFLMNATLVGPESRGSAPVRLPRDTVTLQSPGFSGLYPIGEGAGYAGGIVSAAVDGLRAAKAIIAQYAPLTAK